MQEQIVVPEQMVDVDGVQYKVWIAQYNGGRGYSRPVLRCTKPDTATPNKGVSVPFPVFQKIQSDKVFVQKWQDAEAQWKGGADNAAPADNAMAAQLAALQAQLAALMGGTTTAPAKKGKGKSKKQAA